MKKCGVTPHCLHRDSLTLTSEKNVSLNKINLTIKRVLKKFCGIVTYVNNSLSYVNNSYYNLITSLPLHKLTELTERLNTEVAVSGGL